jgi:magnesium transporter
MESEREQERVEPAIRVFSATGEVVQTIQRDRAAAIIAPQITGTASESAPLVWVDVSNPGEADAAFLREELGLHPLAVEDCIRGRQRPKLDRYPAYLFLVIYAASVNQQRQRMALNELHIFLGERFLVTVHDHRIDEIGEIVRRWTDEPARIPSVGGLAHLLLDAVVDDYFPVLEHFAERAEKLEDIVFENSGPPPVSDILQLRQELVLFRKVVAPQREVLSTLLRRESPSLRPELLPYLQDVHDHTIRVTEEIDSLRELLSAILDAQRSFSTDRLNQTVRTMTAWSIILMSMTLIAGVYGMNFDRMPELAWPLGYPLAMLLMLLVGAGLVMFFRGRRWL